MSSQLKIKLCTLSILNKRSTLLRRITRMNAQREKVCMKTHSQLKDNLDSRRTRLSPAAHLVIIRWISKRQIERRAWIVG